MDSLEENISREEKENVVWMTRACESSLWMRAEHRLPALKHMFEIQRKDRNVPTKNYVLGGKSGINQ